MPTSAAHDLRLLAGAVLLSSAGDLLALALQVHELTGSGLAVSALFATTLMPMVALAPLAGLVADRVESVRVLVVASRHSPLPPSDGHGRPQRLIAGFRDGRAATVLFGFRLAPASFGEAVA